MLVVGDPMQLPPVLASTTIPTQQTTDGDGTGTLIRTLYDRLLAVGWKETILTRQYRCHPHIAGICSRLFYGNKLVHGVKVTERRALVAGLPPAIAIHCGEDGQTTLDGTRVRQQMHEEKRGESFINRAEARSVISLLTLLRSYILGRDECGPRSVGIICAYRAQAQHINSLVTETYPGDSSLAFKVSTVDAFQGQSVI